RTTVPAHPRLRAHGRAADRERDPVTARFHPAGLARPGEDAAAALAGALPRRVGAGDRGLPAEQRSAAAADAPRAAGARGEGRRHADPLAAPRRALPGEAG